MALKKQLFTKKEMTFFETYLNCSSPTGHESPGQQIWLDYLKPYVDAYEVDPYGTAYGIINPKATYKVVIEAHVDEISWYIKYIDDDGFLYVERNGGSDPQIAPSHRVNLHTEKGFVKGVFGWPAIHLRKGKTSPPLVNNLFIDIGASSKQEVLDMGIHIGTIATFDVDLMPLNGNKFYAGRAIDNRVGGFIIAQVARLIKENKDKIPYGLYIVNAVQEEVGLRGAQMVAHRIQPDVAIVTDVGHDTCTPMLKKQDLGEYKCGKGPIITYGPAVHNNLLKVIKTAAEKNKIPYQLEVVSRSTGTDTDAWAYSNAGVVSALISIPLRYMHTTVETVATQDVDLVTRLFYHTVKNIKKGQDFRYIK